MKKLTAMAFGLLFLSLNSSAQSYDTTQYYGKMNYVFQNVDKGPIATGLLKDYGIEFLNLDNYDGIVLHDSNYVALDDWRMLYSSLYSSQITTASNMPYLDTVNRLIRKYNYTSMPITFIGLDFNYNKLKDDAVSSGLMYVNNDQLFDVTGRTQLPYVTKELFAIAPIRQTIFTGNSQFIFRPELFLSNTGKVISSIAYDATGGSNYQTVAFNTPFNLSFPNSGFFDFNIRITYTDNSSLYSHTKIVVYQSPDGSGARYGVRPITTEPVVANKPYQNVFASGDITIDLALNNTTGQIRKPLIFIEGFDPDGSFTYQNGIIPRISYDINFGFPNYLSHPITLNDGMDNTNDYDMIYLHFQNGTDYIQRNAYLLEAVIQSVNTRKTSWNGVRQQNVIIAMSMGGLVARYALRDMELNGQNHETRLFISHDSPYWGANVPVGAQIAVQHLAPWKIINTSGNFPFIQWVDMFPQAVDALNLFNSPAAKQMLIQRYILLPNSLIADNTEHSNFYNELNQMGWPVNCRNITLSNGACDGTKIFPDNSTMFTIDGSRDMKYLGSLWRSLVMSMSGASLNFIGLINGWSNPQFNAWAELWQFPLSLVSNKNSIGVDFKIRAVPISGTQEIYRGDVFSKKKVLGLINVTNYFISSHINSTTDMLPLDNAPGGKYDVNQFGLDPNIITAGLPNFFQGYIQASTLQPQFCFVPTVSSLAIINPQSYIFSSICNNVNCLNATSVQDYFSPQQNELHISYTQNNSNWLLQQQDANFACAKICQSSLSVSGDNSICSTSNLYSIQNLPTGALVQWTTSPSGIVTINSPTAPQTTLTKITNGIITLTATIVNACGGQIVLAKQNITVGPPVLSSAQYTYNGTQNPLQFYTGSSSYNPLCVSQTTDVNATFTGANSVTWSKVSSSNTVSWNQNGNDLNFYLWAAGQTAVFNVQATNGCGNTSYTFGFQAFDCGGGGGGGCAKYSVTNTGHSSIRVVVPNIPSPCRVAVTKKDSSDKDVIALVKVYDAGGKMLINRNFTNARTADISSDLLIPGVYIIEISDGKNIERQKVVVLK